MGEIIQFPVWIIPVPVLKQDRNVYHKLHKSIFLVPILITSGCSQGSGRKHVADVNDKDQAKINLCLVAKSEILQTTSPTNRKLIISFSSPLIG